MGKEKNPTQAYLKQIKLYDTHIINKLADLALMEDRATKITTALKPDAVSGGGFGDKVGDAAAEILDLQRELKKEIHTYKVKKLEITRIIDLVTDADELDVLQKCYVLHQPLNQIAKDKYMTYRNVCHIHGRALQTVAELMKGEQDA